MSELSSIRDLECRLHSHCVEFSDRPLMDELLFLLDELQEIHGELDRCTIQTQDENHLELSLSRRVKRLIWEYRKLKNHHEQMLVGELTQTRLF